MSGTEDSDTTSVSSPDKEKDEGGSGSRQPPDENGFSEKPKPKYPLFVKVNLNVDISYVMTSANHCNVMNVNVKELRSANDSNDNEPKLEMKDIISNIATALKTTFNKRESFTSYSGSSSSASSVGLPVSILTALLGAQTISEDCIKSLKSKWENTDLLLTILKYMDDNICIQGTGDPEHPENVTDSVDDSQVSARVKGEEALSKNPANRKRPSSADSTDEFQPGERVFAQAPDRKYYFSTVESKCGYDLWRIIHQDGKIVKLRGEFLLKNDPDLLFGHNVVFVQKDTENVAYNALIVGHSNGKYKIVSNCGDYEVSPSNLVFTQSNVNEIRGNGNIDDDEESKVSSSKEDSPPKTSGYSSLPLLKLKKIDSSDESSSKKSDDITEDVVIGCKKEIKFNSRGYGIKLKSRKGRMPKSPTDDSIVGPVKMLNLFKGYNFILTCDDTFNKSSSSDEASTDNESYEFSKIPYVYDRLALQITSAKGRIYDSVTELPVSEITRTYLVAPKPCLTEKFVECLALNINMVCHEWIINCVKQERVLPLQFLPVGWSIEKRKFINKFDRTKQKPLQNVTIAFWKKSNKRFIEFWSKICKMAGATICYSEKKKGCNYILADDSYLCESNSSQSSPSQKKTKAVPVVTITWLIQCMINGKCLNPNLNSSAYLYDSP